MHGMFGQSENFIIAGLNNGSLAYHCADSGYDVWLGNTRGNQHGLNHVSLSPDDGKFWDFGWHEISMYDLRAMVDYILNTTEAEKMYYIGHSQGGTIFFTLNSMKPEYQEKFIHASLFAPAGFMYNFKNPILYSLSLRRDWIMEVLRKGGSLQFPPNWFNLPKMLFAVCVEIPLGELCRGLFDWLGCSRSECDYRLIPLVLKYSPTISFKQLAHFFQIIIGGDLRHWDYGEEKNLKVYGASIPPEYPVDKIYVPIAIYHGGGDTYSYSKDNEVMCSKLPNCTRVYGMENPKWSHMDFMFGLHTREKFNEPLVDHMNMF